jgi:hypothetical protein
MQLHHRNTKPDKSKRKVRKIPNKLPVPNTAATVTATAAVADSVTPIPVAPPEPVAPIPVAPPPMNIPPTTVEQPTASDVADISDVDVDSLAEFWESAF